MAVVTKDRLRVNLSISTDHSASPMNKKKSNSVCTLGIEKVSQHEIARRYKIGEQLMESTNEGMTVVQAIRLSDNLPVVIKLRERPGSFKTPELEREWRRTTEVQLSMPRTERLCAYYEVLETPSMYYVVMEKVQGKDLFEVMCDTQPDLDDAKDIVRQVLEALNVLHSHGRIHKDIKIENVMVDIGTPPGSTTAGSLSPEKKKGSFCMTPPRSPTTAKLIDFDTVQDWESTSPRAKEVLGTDGYIAPEAYLGRYSPASDIYAAGVVMYKTLVGDFPTKEDIFDDEPGENWVGSPSMKRIYKRLQKQTIDFDKSPFNKDHLAADLCSKLLSLHARDRPSAKEALEHPWFFCESPNPDYAET